MTHLSPRAIEAGAKAIARLIPTDAGSTWNPGFGEDFPREYSKAEQKQIRTIAQLAITAALEAEGMVVVPADLASRIWKDAENCVPTNWCDDLLTGPNCPKGPLNCPDVEKLLLGVIKRMRDKAALQAAQGGDDASH
jgi:hypothetical protein